MFESCCFLQSPSQKNSNRKTVWIVFSVSMTCGKGLPVRSKVSPLPLSFSQRLMWLTLPSFSCKCAQWCYHAFLLNERYRGTNITRIQTAEMSWMKDFFCQAENFRVWFHQIFTCSKAKQINMINSWQDWLDYKAQICWFFSSLRGCRHPLRSVRSHRACPWVPAVAVASPRPIAPSRAQDAKSGSQRQANDNGCFFMPQNAIKIYTIHYYTLYHIYIYYDIYIYIYIYTISPVYVFFKLRIEWTGFTMGENWIEWIGLAVGWKECHKVWHRCSFRSETFLDLASARIWCRSQMYAMTLACIEERSTVNEWGGEVFQRLEGIRHDKTWHGGVED